MCGSQHKMSRYWHFSRYCVLLSISLNNSIFIQSIFGCCFASKEAQYTGNKLLHCSIGNILRPLFLIIIQCIATSKILPTNAVVAIAKVPQKLIRSTPLNNLAPLKKADIAPRKTKNTIDKPATTRLR